MQLNLAVLDLGMILTDPDNELLGSLFRIRYLIFKEELNPQTFILLELPAVCFGIINLGLDSNANVVNKDP